MAEAFSLSEKRATAGREGARRRWSEPGNRKVVRLDDLTREQRAVVIALVDAARSAKAGSDAA